MNEGVRVRTDGDNYAILECGMTEVELSKDGDSPACPNSWTLRVYLDGYLLDSTCEETSLAQAVMEAAGALAEIAVELVEMKNYLDACGAFGSLGSDA